MLTTHNIVGNDFIAFMNMKLKYTLQGILN